MSFVARKLFFEEAAPRVVDSWFVDNGQPAAVLPLKQWKKGGGPHV